MAGDSTQDKTHKPTPKKLADAKKNGEVPRSDELSKTISLLAGFTLLWIGFAGILRGIIYMLTEALSYHPGKELTPETLLGLVGEFLYAAFSPLFPIAIALAVIMYLSETLMGGQIFRLKNAAPKLSNLDIVKGFGEMVSASNAMTLLKSILKLCLVLSVLSVAFGDTVDHFVGLMGLPYHIALGELGRTVIVLLLAYSASLIVITAIDVGFQQKQFMKQMMMTTQDIREEFKQMEGDPMIKGRIRETANRNAQSSSLEAVPAADAVLVNPEHYAVAIRYDKSKDPVPRVLSIGGDHLAFRIRQIATAHEIPVLPVPPLARAIYFNCQPGGFIPKDLFEPVATVLSYLNHLDDPLSFKIDESFLGDLNVPRELSDPE
ncbi:EscU/YscU/HrcU family type III secretion system export apparatus switch protein [Ferrimonas marina]|uniref:Flagellar biosynthetic protein FlhB n=1 Tax=Ferrimonas marina TaxID=299255 RepID=A0A1M5TG99_9GAMM|nr:flagellar type III secretion system protein FlhB [Ferrimonas marina]SHH49734.1 flagellar biosynthetic protein FlhB [Ferrimonas marina]